MRPESRTDPAAIAGFYCGSARRFFAFARKTIDIFFYYLYNLSVLKQHKKHP